MIRCSSSFLYNDAQLKLDSTLKTAKARMPSGPVPSGPGPCGHVPPAGHVPHVVVMGGPGKDVFTPGEVRNVAQRLAPLASRCELIVNDGGRSGAPQPVATGLITSLRASPKEPVLLVVRTHGSLAPDGHFKTELDEGVELSGTSLLHIIGSLRQAPVQIFISSCLGWSFLEGVPHLPEGSVVVVLAPEGRSVTSDDVRTLNINLDTLKCLSAFSMLLLYCACALKTKIPPSVFMPNGAIIDLECQLDSIRKKRLGEADRALVHQQLDDLVGAGRVNETMALVETLESVGDVSEDDYGMALAVAAVLGGIVVEAAAVTPVPQATLHDVIRGTTEEIQTMKLPQLNLGHEGVKAMLAERGKAVVLKDGSAIYLSKERDVMLLLQKSKGKTVTVLLQKLVGCEVLKIQEIQGDAETIAQFQQNGVLQADASPVQGTSIIDLV